MTDLMTEIISYVNHVVVATVFSLSTLKYQADGVGKFDRDNLRFDLVKKK